MGSLYILVLLFLAGAFCLAPLTVYLLWLAQITRRDQPTVLAGTWDFAGLIVGLSGFILFGGALVLTVLQENFRFWMHGNIAGFRVAWDNEKVTWILLASAYLILVVGGITLTLLSRRQSLVFYNIDPNSFEATLTEVFEHLGRPIERRGNLWLSSVPLFELDLFPRGRTVTLRWINEDQLLFVEVERLLREGVRSLFTENNPSTHWLQAAAVGAGVSTICCFGLLIYAVRVMSH